MTRSAGGFYGAVMVLGLLADPAFAQPAGNPVYAYNPSAGLTLNADFGGGVNAGSGNATFIGGRAVLGVSMGSLWVGGGIFDDRDSAPGAETTLGGGAAVNLLKRRTSPVAATLQVGGSTVGCGVGCSMLDVAAGPALKVNVPTRGIGVEPWIMPRVHLSRMSFREESLVQTGFGASCGASINLSVGLGIHGVVDIAHFGATASGNLTAPGGSPVTAGVGVHYTISSGVGGVP